MWESNIAHRNLESVVKSVLVLRVVAKDAATTASEAQLSGDIFGGDWEGLNLKSGFDRCSYGQLQFQPVTTNKFVGTDGVFTVNISNTTVAGAHENTVLNDVLVQATNVMGNHPALIADHVMVCLPPGTRKGWVSFASVNSWMSVYNDVWCQYPSAQMHEFGKS